MVSVTSKPGRYAPEGTYEREPLKVIPKRFLICIGRVIVAHSRLEHYLTELIGDLQRTDYPIIRQVLENAPTVQNIIKINRLIDLWNIVPTEPLETLRDDIEAASQKRNEVAHGVWLCTPQHDIALRIMRGERMTTEGSLTRRTLPQAPPAKTEIFDKYVQYIDGVTDRVRKLQAHVRAQLESWPYIQPVQLRKPNARPTRGRK